MSLLEVRRRESDPGATLHFSRAVLGLRRSHPSLRQDRCVALHADALALVALRDHGCMP